MLDIIQNYPLFVGIVLIVIIFLVKNHFLASNDDISKVQEKVIKNLKENKIFITREELTDCESKIRQDVESRFLSLAVFNEFKTGIDRQFKTVFTRFDEGSEQFKELSRGINEIKNYLIKGNR